MENNLQKLKYRRAKRRMKEIKYFYFMLFGCVLLSPYLIFINLTKTPEFHWFWFPLSGFSVSLLSYAIYVFTGRKWENRKIQELMDHEFGDLKSL
ncbi:2TM domain-containing protein [Chryseobacterium sp. MYb264]|uniref:2TM domain-containing protein n=1 Tax=Chryseobacterium sp. MYb264 TaxID=2745153 RepID=UPI002E1358A2|nr:2TM domain-containing protein [Chryseobacterium sp. MYb264]